MVANFSKYSWFVEYFNDGNASKEEIAKPDDKALDVTKDNASDIGKNAGEMNSFHGIFLSSETKIPKHI